MKITKMLYVTNRKDWRRWLEKYSESEKEIWLVYFKKHTKKPTIPYEDAVEEALCFGWIDSTVKRIDDEKYVQRYSPRNLNSVWSQYNLSRVEKMIREGKMTEVGIAKYNYGLKHNLQAPLTRDKLVIPKDFKDALKHERIADEHFKQLAKSYKIMYIHWVESAKREETRKRRIKKVIGLLKDNKKPWETVMIFCVFIKLC